MKHGNSETTLSLSNLKRNVEVIIFIFNLILINYLNYYIFQLHKLEKKQKRMLDAQEAAEMYKKPTMTTSRRSKTKTYRLPVVHLNAIIEEVIYK